MAQAAYRDENSPRKRSSSYTHILKASPGQYRPSHRSTAVPKPTAVTSTTSQTQAAGQRASFDATEAFYGGLQWLLESTMEAESKRPKSLSQATPLTFDALRKHEGKEQQKPGHTGSLKREASDSTDSRTVESK